MRVLFSALPPSEATLGVFAQIPCRAPQNQGLECHQGLLQPSLIERVSFKLMPVTRKAHLGCANSGVKLGIPGLERQLPAGLGPPAPTVVARWSQVIIQLTLSSKTSAPSMSTGSFKIPSQKVSGETNVHFGRHSKREGIWKRNQNKK